MADKKIILLKDSDIVSGSMHNINYNFSLLENETKVNEYRWQKYVKSIDKKISDLKSGVDGKNSAVSRKIDGLQDLIDSMMTGDEIRDQVNAAIRDSENVLKGFIKTTVGEQIGEAFGDYATKSELTDLENSLEHEYVNSSAFENFKADSSARAAAAYTIAANSTFMKSGDFPDQYLVFADGDDSDENVSTYKTIDDYWKALTIDQREELMEGVDLDGSDLRLELKDQSRNVLDAFMEHCVGKFKTIHTEMASIKESVGPGSAEVDIIASINDNIGEITASIFLEANRDGSSILLNADHIQIDANHRLLGLTAGDILINSENRLALVGGTFTINSDNFNVDENGFMQAQGVKISGDITADKFSATWNGTIDSTFGTNGRISGPVTKTTQISGENFNIGVSSNGLTINEDGDTSTYNPTGNSLYIKIVDVLKNNNSDISGEYLYGVPALCMTYDGVEYILSPASWFNPNVEGNTSNMRFMPVYDSVVCELPEYTDTGYSAGSVNIGGLTSGIYIFRTDNVMSSLNSTNTDKVYMFSVLNWGDNEEYCRNTLDYPSVKLLGSYTLNSILTDAGGQKFTNSGGVQTVITDTNRDAMIACLPKAGRTYPVAVRHEYIKTDYPSSSGVPVLPEIFGIRKIAEMMRNMIRKDYNPSNTITNVSGLWKVYDENTRTYNGCVFTSPNNIIDNNLPCMVKSGDGQNEYHVSVYYYPICTIQNPSNGTPHGKADKIAVNYVLKISSSINYENTDVKISTGLINDIIVENFWLQLKFSAVIDIDGEYDAYNPGDVSTYQDVRNKVEYFLNNFDYGVSDIIDNSELTGAIQGRYGQFDRINIELR